MCNFISPARVLRSLQEVDRGWFVTRITRIHIDDLALIHRVHPYRSSTSQMDGEKVDEAEWSESLNEEDVTEWFGSFGLTQRVGEARFNNTCLPFCVLILPIGPLGSM